MKKQKIKFPTEKECMEYYKEWVNNFLTLDYFCEYFNFTKNQAILILNEGKRLYNKIKL